MGLDSMGTEIYAINGYFRGLTVRQRTLGFLECHSLVSELRYMNTYGLVGMGLGNAVMVQCPRL